MEGSTPQELLPHHAPRPVDVVDNHEYFWRLFYRRRKFYNDAMCRVVMLNIENWMKLRNYYANRRSEP